MPITSDQRRPLVAGFNTSLVAIILILLAFVAQGCAASSHTPVQGPLGERQMQSVLMSASDDLMFSVADACAQVVARTKRADSQSYCHNLRLGTGMGALDAATCPHTRVGYADLLTLVTVQRMAIDEPAARTALDEEDRLLIQRTLTNAEERLWSKTDQGISAEQKQELRQLIVAWRQAHPERVSVSQLRLEDFENERLGSASSKDNPNLSILRLLQIDPMQGLDPATRQLRETSLLAERVAFWAQRLPVLLGWQVELTSGRLMRSQAVDAVVQNGAQISQAISDFSKSTDRFAASYEKTLEELPKERTATIQQMDHALSEQTKALIDQTAVAVAAERSKAVEQIGQEFSKRAETFVSQVSQEADRQSKSTLDHAAQVMASERKLMLAEAEETSKRLVDRMANRLLVVIAMGVGIVVLAALIYRVVSARLTSGASRRLAVPSRSI